MANSMIPKMSTDVADIYVPLTDLIFRTETRSAEYIKEACDNVRIMFSHSLDLPEVNKILEAIENYAKHCEGQ